MVDYFYKSSKGNDSKRKNNATLPKEDAQNLDMNALSCCTDATSQASIEYKDTIVIESIYDNMNNLVEIVINKVSNVPRILMQLIGLMVPYFRKLNRINIRNCKTNVYTIHELRKMIPFSTITDVCLNGSTLSEINYATLLDSPIRLNHLSLSKCLISDDVCVQIASKLQLFGPAEANLLTLDLSINEITDVGATSLAEALKTNRNLRYLNLAGNRITDDGACSLFNYLIDFPLSCDEIVEKRRRRIGYLRAKRDLIMKYIGECDSKSFDEYSQISKKSTVKKRKTSATSVKGKGYSRKEKLKRSSLTDDDLNCKAEMLANEMLGPYMDPFGPGSTKIKDGEFFCIGNLVLCYLNLAYNNLTYTSITKLHQVLIQQAQHKKHGQPGLIKIVLDGNELPIACTELTQIYEILNKNISCFGSHTYSEGMRRKSRTARVSLYEHDEK
ncbi:uncharacterized protein LOC101738863 isoform X2 [Bombyx mori]|uniref:Leucine-rich repeat-containing protein 71 n=1 Tax=Bombyx mori TaxID=7091 RepID=A0A8R1WKY4_BOMMO|nr:uncharacterized protein LOC101738863 isoform X2 [Bombyx mori]